MTVREKFSMLFLHAEKNSPERMCERQLMRVKRKNIGHGFKRGKQGNYFDIHQKFSRCMQHFSFY
jgi:hypothetical protein